MRASPAQPRLDPRWVEARFDRIARTYPIFERLFLVPSQARIRAMEQLHLHAGDRVLSIGCGRGPMLPQLSRSVGANGHVLGIDLSRRMLDVAERCVTEHQLANVHLFHTNLFDYPATNSFDAILFGFSLSSFGDPHAALRRAWSMLAPGGRLVVLDGQLPPRLRWMTRPAMPLIRLFMEATVLGDPDMRPIEAMDRLATAEVEYFRSGSYFVAHVVKPGSAWNNERTTPPIKI